MINDYIPILHILLMIVKLEDAGLEAMEEKTHEKLGFKYYVDAIKVEKLKKKIIARSRMARTKMWMIRVVTMVLIWCCSMQLLYLNETCWEPNRVFTSLSSVDISSNFHYKRKFYHNNGYLMVSTNGGLNQMRAGICDMVTIARYLNVTLIVPELDKSSFWKDQSEFHDIFDVHYFINSLKDEVQILRELPRSMKRRINSENLLSMPPISWSNMSYYYNIVLPEIINNKVVHFNKSDSRLANNGVPIDVQKFRCRVNYESLRFTPALEELGKRIVQILRRNGPYLALHLRYEMDMLAFSGCTQGCEAHQVEELTSLRYAYPWWKEKDINATKKRISGQCPLTPEETLLTLKALEIDPNIQLYIAAGDIYGGETRLASLAAYFPNMMKKETLLDYEELSPFMNHSSQMAALDYIVSLESDIFVATYGGNMANLVEGHRRYLGYRTTINLNRKALVKLIDRYRNGLLSWDEFGHRVKWVHKNRMGSPKRRVQIPEKPKLEDYFYTNPQECLPQSNGISDE